MNQLEKEKRLEIVDLHLILEDKKNQIIDEIEKSCQNLTTLGLEVDFDPEKPKLYFDL